MYLGPTAGDVRSLPKGAVDMTLTKPSKVLLCRTLRLAVEPNIEAATRGIASTLEGLGYQVDEIENPAPGATMIDWGIISVSELSQSLVHLSRSMARARSRVAGDAVDERVPQPPRLRRQGAAVAMTSPRPMTACSETTRC